MTQEETKGTKNHFSGVVIGRENGERAEVLVQPYHYRGRVQLKFPGGMSVEGEDPNATARRELEQETNLIVPSGALVPAWEKQVNDAHSKHFFACRESDVSGSIRTEPMREENGGEEVLMPPEWREVTAELLDEIFGSHQPALQSAIGIFSQRFANFHYAGARLGLV